jgi:hypothetical protein
MQLTAGLDSGNYMLYFVMYSLFHTESVHYIKGKILSTAIIFIALPLFK